MWMLARMQSAFRWGGKALSFELFIASRYLVSRRKQAFISIISLVSVLGVAIGVAALVVVMGVYNGFTTDIRDKILGSNSHILVMATDITAFDPPSYGAGLAGQDSTGGDDTVAGQGIAAESSTTNNVSPLLAKVQAIPGVKAATPYLYTEVLLSTPRGATGLILRGIDPRQAGEALPLLHELSQGSVSGLLTEADGAEAQGPPGIIVGKDLADRFQLQVGSRINLMSPAGQRTTAGFAPKIKSFKVVGIFRSGMSDYDNRLAYVSLSASQDLMGLPAGRISGIEAFVNDPYAARDVAQSIENLLGAPFYARNWMDMNAGLFAALQLERIGMFIVLAMIILVGSFSIITSLVMLVMEKTRDIAILMSMGATNGTIRRIFMLQGTIIGAVGTGLGYAFGLTLAWLLKKYQFIQLPPGVYTMDKLPILISVPDTVLIGVVSLLMCFLATIYPARQAARLVPAEALRYE